VGGFKLVTVKAVRLILKNNLKNVNIACFIYPLNKTGKAGCFIYFLNKTGETRYFVYFINKIQKTWRFP